MQSIVIDKPYVPVPPHRGRTWPAILSLYVPRLLRKKFGVTKVEIVHADRLLQSINLKHGILLTPNHCRDEDPFVMDVLSRTVGSPFFIMASWHVFMQGWKQAFLLRRAGAFSIYREGIDRTAVNTAVDILETAERPLVIFPEGFIARTNDRINELLDGTALIARTAAKRRAKSDAKKKVVVHPIAIRYKFTGDINTVGAKILNEIEHRLTWATQSLSLYDRIYKVGSALLALKELEYLGQAENGEVIPRLNKLIDFILAPLEKQWLNDEHKEEHKDSVPSRVKRLRSAILPDLTKGELSEAESQKRWKNLADLYLAQQLFHYPPDYLGNNPTPERLLETLERLEEDVTDKIKVRGTFHATVTVGEAIEVNPERPRGGHDPLLGDIREQLIKMLGITPP